MLKNSEASYGLVSRTIHWLMALLVVVVFAIGLYRSGLEKGDPSLEIAVTFHQSLGVVVLLGLILRLAWLGITRPPALPRVFSPLQKGMAIATRLALYLLMFLVPFSGYVMSNLGGNAVELFGLGLPTLFGENRDAEKVMKEVHEFGAWVLIILAFLHMLGALKHRFFDLDPEADVLRRMWR